MAAVPTERPTSILGALISLGTLLVFCVAGALVAPRPEVGVLVGAAIFLVYRLVVREGLCRDHRRGIRLTRAGDFRGGLDAFKRSEAFWGRHALLDRYRWVVLGSSGPYRFLTLARYNQAYCLSRLNRVPEAMRLVEQVLGESPKMSAALELKAALLNALSGDPTAERTWNDHLAESTWVFDEPGRKSED